MKRVTTTELLNKLYNELENVNPMDTNKSRTLHRINASIQMVEQMDFETFQGYETNNGHVNIGTIAECFVRYVVLGENGDVGVHDKGYVDMKIKTTDTTKKRGYSVESFEIKACFKDASSAVDFKKNRPLFLIDYSGMYIIDMVTMRKLRNEKPELFKIENGNKFRIKTSEKGSPLNKYGIKWEDYKRMG